MKRKRKKKRVLSPKQTHQFRRFQAKGMVTGTVTYYKGILEDFDNFSLAERDAAMRIVKICQTRLIHWRNTLGR